MGGVATRATLIGATSRAAVDAALAAGDLVAVARGRYALASADEAVRAAHRVSGVVSHFSAALHHGWQVRQDPDLPQVTVAKGRSPTAEHRRGLELHRTDLGPDDVVGRVTSQERTLVDCLRSGSFADGLCVADSALREGFAPARLRAVARDLRGPGSAQVRAVAAAADGRAANAFESALRAIALGVEDLSVVPQVPIRGPGFLGRPDLVDERLGIVLEADSFEWHGDRAGLVRDARRYNRFAVAGWLVLRFTWEDVILHPHEVARMLAAAVAQRTERECRCRSAA